MAVIYGSIKRDVLSGTSNDDAIYGLDGNDSILRSDGNDYLDGGPGDDTIEGGYGNDTLIGGDGDDKLYGYDATTIASSPDGNDVFFGGAGDNVMYGGTGVLNSTLTGNDVFYIGSGNNAAAGGDGIDVAVFELPRRSYAITQGLLGFPTASSSQARGDLVQTSYGGTAVQDRIIEVENLQFLDGRIVRDPDDPISKVVRLYKAALNRLPDAEGLNFWATNITSGAPVSALANAFAGSAEFAARFGTGDNTSYVQQLYRNTLGREGDAAGVGYWTGRLNGGTTRGDVLLGFSESPENKANTAALIQAGVWDQDDKMSQVARLYDTAFNRLPDLAGLFSWKAAVNAGTTISQIAQSFTSAPEFLAIYGGAGTAAGTLVDALYSNTLNRSADAAGRAYWVQQLQTGAQSRAQVVLGFSESAEHRINATPDIEGGLRFT